MTDVVNRLRHPAGDFYGTNLLSEAADEIERLRGINKILAEALKRLIARSAVQTILDDDELEQLRQVVALYRGQQEPTP